MFDFILLLALKLYAQPYYGDDAVKELFLPVNTNYEVPQVDIFEAEKIFNINTKEYGNIILELHENDNSNLRPPKTRREAHLSYFAATGEKITEISQNFPCPEAGHETNLTGFFRDDSGSINFPSPDMICESDANCVSNYPSVFFSIRIANEANCVTFLTTGDTSISTSTIPQKNDLPRTIWVHREPVRNIYWSGHFAPSNNSKVFFLARPVKPGTTFNSIQRIDVAQIIIKTLKESTKG